MPFAICLLSVVPVRRFADLISEMTTQVRGGEGVEILEQKDQWWRVRLLTDGYEGWVNSRHFTKPAATAPVAATVFTDDHCGEATSGEWRVALPLGSPLPEFNDGKFVLGAESWEWTGRTRTVPADPPDKSALLAFARRFLHAPYHWGGRTVFGIDCSGFAQSVFRAFGIPLLRDSPQQVTQGAPVPDLAAAVPGDLIFFGTPGLGVFHVGLLLPCSGIIHASAMVRIDDITAEGIRNKETGTVTHTTVAIRRMF